MTLEQLFRTSGAADNIDAGRTYRVVRTEVLSRRKFEVVGRTQNVSRLFERILNFACVEQGCGGSILDTGKLKSLRIVIAWNLLYSHIHCLGGPVETCDSTQQLCCTSALVYKIDV